MKFRSTLSHLIIMPVGVGTKPKGNLATSDVLIEVKGKEQGGIKL